MFIGDPALITINFRLVAASAAFCKFGYEVFHFSLKVCFDSLVDVSSDCSGVC